MKFKNYLETLDGVSIYPMLSLILFMTIFSVVVVYVFTADKKTIDEKANIPLK